MQNKVQEAAKQKVIELLEKYDVSYIDYDAKEDEYSIRLDKEQDDITRAYVDGGKIAERIYTEIEPGEQILAGKETDG
ncbi:hypothetical protein [Bacillus massiliglaciei]|uniref:hypothetical protein n=1 Tax=Bacillus massiliglaciei TaxID=1816693 RepID=UPI000DA6059C|nr:hypothetical protein [Bacillus massiliglaciei]